MIKLALDSSQVKRGVAKLKESFKAMGKTLSDGFRTAAKLATGMFVGLTAATLLYFRKFATEMDRIGKLSKRFGETAESMQRIGMAAKLGGTDLETVAKAIQNFVRNLILAESGSKTAADAVAELGLSSKELIDLPIEDQLIAISRAFTRAGGSARTLAAMQDLLGRGGPELAALVSEGPEALAKAFAETVTVSGRTVAAMELVNDTIARMANIIMGSFGEAISAIVPMLEEKLPIWTEKLKAFGGMVGDAIKQAIEGDSELLVAMFTVAGDRAGSAFVEAAKSAFSKLKDSYMEFFKEKGRQFYEWELARQTGPKVDLTGQRIEDYAPRNTRDSGQGGGMIGSGSSAVDKALDVIAKHTGKSAQELEYQRQLQEKRAAYAATREAFGY